MVQPTRQRHGRRKFLERLVAGTTVAASASPAGGSGVRAQEGAISSFDHVAVPMQNTEEMITFYRALGVHVMETAGRVSVHFGDQKINFHRPASWQRATPASLGGPAPAPPAGAAGARRDAAVRRLLLRMVWLGGIADGRPGSSGGRDHRLGHAGRRTRPRDGAWNEPLRSRPGRQPPGVHDLLVAERLRAARAWAGQCGFEGKALESSAVTTTAGGSKGRN